MTACTFVHAADLHLDAPFRGLTARLSRPSPAQHQEQPLAHMAQNATFIALERLTATCLAVHADFLILAGDVYNSRESSLRARLALRDAFLTLEKAGIRVFLAHGNHDPLIEEDNAIPWPGNVTVFEGGISSHTVTRNGAPIGLTPLEFDLLLALAKKPRQALTREQLLQDVWGYRHPGDTRLVNVHVQRLRSKIEHDPERPEIVVTVRGIGYRAGITSGS